MRLSSRYLLDVNVLIAMIDDEHQHFPAAQNWFAKLAGREWATCPLTETGLIRYVMNPATGFPANGLKAAVNALSDLSKRPGHSFWPIIESWTTLTKPFAERIFGHQQVTDAYLLGIAVKQNGVLVTFDHGLRNLAGSNFARNLLVLE